MSPKEEKIRMQLKGLFLDFSVQTKKVDSIELYNDVVDRAIDYTMSLVGFKSESQTPDSIAEKPRIRKKRSSNRPREPKRIEEPREPVPASLVLA